MANQEVPRRKTLLKKGVDPNEKINLISIVQHPVSSNGNGFIKVKKAVVSAKVNNGLIAIRKGKVIGESTKDGWKEIRGTDVDPVLLKEILHPGLGKCPVIFREVRGRNQRRGFYSGSVEGVIPLKLRDYDFAVNQVGDRLGRIRGLKTAQYTLEGIGAVFPQGHDLNSLLEDITRKIGERSKTTKVELPVGKTMECVAVSEGLDGKNQRTYGDFLRFMSFSGERRALVDVMSRLAFCLNYATDINYKMDMKVPLAASGRSNCLPVLWEEEEFKANLGKSSIRRELENMRREYDLVLGAWNSLNSSLVRVGESPLVVDKAYFPNKPKKSKKK